MSLEVKLSRIRMTQIIHAVSLAGRGLIQSTFTLVKSGGETRVTTKPLPRIYNFNPSQNHLSLRDTQTHISTDHLSRYNLATTPQSCDTSDIHSINKRHAGMFTDPELSLVLIVVGGVLLLQIFAAIAILWYCDVKGKAKWRHLREQGIVVVNGPALYWADEMLARPYRPGYNVRQVKRAIH
jgi:hypothetical protein